MTPQHDAGSTPVRLHLPSLTVALIIMLAGTLYPPLMVNAAGQVNHGLAMAFFLAMSAGFVRGVGFVPLAAPWRWLFSGWACTAALVVAGGLKFNS
jgi:predicted membrane protein